jgi:amino acid adenylation domain-containing protein
MGAVVGLHAFSSDAVPLSWAASHPDLVAAAPEAKAADLNHTTFAQPALFVFEWSLAQLLLSRGFSPAAMAGHSIGEIVAATLAGVLELHEALGLVAVRARSMGSMQPGQMLAVSSPVSATQKVVAAFNAARRASERVHMAVVNSPRAAVVGGDASAMASFEAHLASSPKRVPRTVLKTSHAFHTPMMADAGKQVQAYLEGVGFSGRVPRVAYACNVSGDMHSTSAPISAAYFSEHVTGTVRFHENMHALKRLYASHARVVVLEVGPSMTLSRLATQALKPAKTDPSPTEWLCHNLCPHAKDAIGNPEATPSHLDDVIATALEEGMSRSGGTDQRGDTAAVLPSRAGGNAPVKPSAAHALHDEGLSGRVLGAFAECLGEDPSSVDLDSDFYKLGGTSLTLVQLCSSLSSIAGTTITVADVLGTNGHGGAITPASLLHSVQQGAQRSKVPPTQLGVPGGSGARMQTADGSSMTPLPMEAAHLWAVQQAPGAQPICVAHATVYTVDELVADWGVSTTSDTLAGVCEQLAHVVRDAMTQLASQVPCLRSSIVTAMLPSTGRRGPVLRAVPLDEVATVVHRAVRVGAVCLSTTQAVGAARERASEPIEWSSAPLWHVDIIPILNTDGKGTQGAMLAWTTNHCIMDGGGGAAMAAAMDAGLRHRIQSAVSLEQFAQEERALLSSEEGSGRAAWWAAVLRDVPELTRLPLTTLRTVSTQGAFDSAPLQLSRQVVENLTTVARACACTMNSALLTLWASVLNRYSNDEDIPLAMPYANRGLTSSGDSTMTLGSLAHTLIVRVDLSSDAAEGNSLRQQMEEVHRCVMGAISHSMPFSAILDAVAASSGSDPRAHPWSPLVQVGLTLQAAPGGPSSGRMVLVPSRMASFDLHMWLMQDAASGEVTGLLHYNTALFSPDRAAQLASNLVEAAEHVSELVDLHGVDAALRTPLAAVRIVPEAVGKRVTDAINTPWRETESTWRSADSVIASLLASEATASPASTLPSIHMRALLSAQRKPSATAVVGSDASPITYAQLIAQAACVSEALVRAGVQVGDRVAVVLPRCKYQVGVCLGVLACGAVYVPLDPSNPAKRLSLISQRAEPSAVIVLHGDDPSQAAADAICSSDQATPVLPLLVHERSRASSHSGLSIDFTVPRVVSPADLNTALGADVVRVLTRLQSVRHWHVAAHPKAAASLLAYLIFTSGSSGTPRGVAVTHGNVTTFSLGTIAHMGMGATDVVGGIASFAFDLSVFEMWTTLFAGGTYVCITNELVKSTKELQEWLADQRVTMLCMTPQPFYLLADADAAARLRGAPAVPLRRVMLGGDAVNFGRLKDYLQYGEEHSGCLVYAGWGPTETTVFATYRRITTEDADAALLTRQEGGFGGLPSTGSLIGWSMPGYRCTVVNQAGELVPEGGIGEVVVAGPAVSQGYFGMPAATGLRWRRMPRLEPVLGPWANGVCHLTGDLVLVRKHGVMDFVSRKDTQIKVRGLRMDTGEVEAAVGKAVRSMLPQAALAGAGLEMSVHVLPRGHVAKDPLPAFVVLDHASRVHGKGAVGLDAAARLVEAGLPRVRAAVAAALPTFMHPSSLAVVRGSPHTWNGKLDRQALLKLE